LRFLQDGSELEMNEEKIDSKSATTPPEIDLTVTTESLAEPEVINKEQTSNSKLITQEN
jgi:hypothetical protein